MNRSKSMAAALTSLLAACGTHVDPAVDRAVLYQIRNRIVAAENAGDASIFKQVAARNVVVMPPGTAPINGQDASVEAMRRFFETSELRIEYASAEIVVMGDVAIDRGTYSQTTVAKGGGEPSPAKGSYLWVYQRTDDGRWLQTHAIWNLD